MVLLESLRLYSPVVIIRRIAGSDIDLGNLKIPKGTVLSIPIAKIHRDRDVWGPDADEFNPARFKNGVSRAASYPNALLSFSQGPRGCIGQTFAMLESQIAIAMILQRFEFRLSPSYVHAPMEAITLRPRFGLPVVLRNLQGWDGPYVLLYIIYSVSISTVRAFIIYLRNFPLFILRKR